MAALNQSPSGFSYAQAAKGRSATTPAKTPSSKVTSGTGTAAPATGGFAELGPNSNWADDVEATVGDKTADTRKASSEQSKSHTKDNAVERTKSESRPVNGSSGVSTPDIAALSTRASNTDDNSAAQNGTSSSDTTWETKSQNSAQNSDPSWIAERKERQDSAPGEENSKGRRGKKEPKESKDAATRPPTPKSVVLTDAPPPMVNPWAKRMEAAKAKPAVMPLASKLVAVPSPQPDVKENQRPSSEPRKKTNPATAIPGEAANSAAASADAKKSSVSQSKRANEVRHSARQGSKSTAEEALGDSGAVPPTKAIQREHKSLPNLTAAPPPVKDDVAWPTPEIAQEKERKDPQTEKDADDNVDAEATAGAKREKTKWKPVAVTPTIVWQTEEMNRPPRGQNGERGGRGGNGARGRGGLRGAPNGSKGGDRAATRNGSSPSEVEATGSGIQRERSSTIDREAPATAAKANTQRSSGNQTQAEGHASASANALSHTNGITVDAVSSISATAPVFDAGHSYSPRKISPEISGDQQTVKMPEPTLPHQSHSPAQPSDAADSAEAARDGPTIRRVPSDGRKEARSFESLNGKEWNGAPRGGKRGGRGRGGSREYSNGHQAGQPFVNGHADYVNAFAGVPPSPSAYQASRSPYVFTQQGRGGWQRGASRSQSIPVENVYGGRQVWSGAQLPPMQTYLPSMYDYQSGLPYAAVPFHPMAEHQHLLDMVHTQLDYYFSMDNLLKDMFLRKNMDGQGFVFLDTIANFNRVKQLTVDKEILRAVCLRSDTIEIRVGEDGKERLRRREGWEQFVLPREQRETTAQTDGPQLLQRPEQPHLQFWSPPSMFRGPPAAGVPGRRSYDSGFPMNGGVAGFAPFSPLAEVPYGDFTNGEEGRGRSAKSPTQDNSISHGQQAFVGQRAGDDSEPDVFPNQNIEALTVVVRPGLQRSSVSHHAASRTFSNGSIDTRSIQGELEKSADEGTQPTTNGEPVVNGDHNGTAVSRHTSPTLTRPPEKGSSDQDLALFWCKDKDLPQEKIPQDGTTEPYIALRAKAIKQRDEAATGNCPYDLDVLYQFWSHFLIRNFNKSMYREFQELAHLDAQERRNGVGMRNLVQFYAKALSSTNPIRDNIIRDYVALVNNEPHILGGAAYKQLRQAWRDGALNLKNRKKLADILDEPLKNKLEGQA